MRLFIAAVLGASACMSSGHKVVRSSMPRDDGTGGAADAAVRPGAGGTGGVQAMMMVRLDSAAAPRTDVAAVTPERDAAARDAATTTDAAGGTGALMAYVGSGFYTTPTALVAYRIDPANGTLTELQRLPSDPSPSFLAVHPGGKFLYAGLESGATGAAAYAIDAAGKLSKLNQIKTGASGAAYTSIDATGRWLFQANYESQSVSVIEVKADGSLGAVVDTRMQGAGAYPHSVRADPTNHFVFVANRSGNSVSQYLLDVATGKLTPNDPAQVTVPAGTGPRHIDFHPNLQLAFVDDETASTVAPYRFDAKAGTLARLTPVSTLPAGAAAGNAPADMRLHPSGNFLYVANRGASTIAIFSVDAATGKLTAIGFPASGGKGPRNLAIDPSGRFMVVGNLESDQVQAFAIDAASGKLAPAGAPVMVPKPSGVAIVRLR